MWSVVSCSGGALSTLIIGSTPGAFNLTVYNVTIVPSNQSSNGDQREVWFVTPPAPAGYQPIALYAVVDGVAYNHTRRDLLYYQDYELMEGCVVSGR